VNSPTGSVVPSSGRTTRAVAHTGGSRSRKPPDDPAPDGTGRGTAAVGAAHAGRSADPTLSAPDTPDAPDGTGRGTAAVGAAHAGRSADPAPLPTDSTERISVGMNSVEGDRGESGTGGPADVGTDDGLVRPGRSRGVPAPDRFGPFDASRFGGGPPEGAAGSGAGTRRAGDRSMSDGQAVAESPGDERGGDG